MKITITAAGENHNIKYKMVNINTVKRLLGY